MIFLLLIAGIVLWALAVANPLGLILTIIAAVIIAIRLVLIIAIARIAVKAGRNANIRF